MGERQSRVPFKLRCSGECRLSLKHTYVAGKSGLGSKFRETSTRKTWRQCLEDGVRLEPSGNKVQNGMLSKPRVFDIFHSGCVDWRGLKSWKGYQGPRNVISGNLRSISRLFLSQGCAWVTFQSLNLEQSVPKLFHQGPLDLGLRDT